MLKMRVIIFLQLIDTYYMVFVNIFVLCNASNFKMK